MASAAPSSRMAQLYERHRAALRRLDDLESRLASRAAAHRRRATNVVEEVPTSRRTHARIFVSHRVEGGDDADDDDEEEGKKEEAAPAPAAPAPAPAAAAAARPGGKDFGALLHSSAHQPVEQAAKKAPRGGQPTTKGVRTWTLVVEGGLLVPHLDHASATAVDAKLDAGLPILGSEGLTDDEAGTHGADAPRRERWRGGAAEREGEKDVEPLIFTHLFDKMEVELKIIKKQSEKPLETTAVTRSGLGAVPEPPSPEAVAEAKTFAWERARSQTPDSNAFFVVHTEASDFQSLGGKVFKSVFNVDHVKAKIKLFRRQGEEGNYVPSRAMCEAFFPTFIGKRAAAEQKSRDKGGKSKKRKKSGGGGEAIARTDSSANLQTDASNSSIPPGKEAAFASRQSSALSSGEAPPPPVPASAGVEDTDADSYVPQTVTVDEALRAIFFYVRTRNLQDATDLSVVNNDETLAALFGCNRMLFSAVRGLLLERQLLVQVQPGTHPIIFNYNMTLGGAEPLTKKRKPKSAEPKEETPEKSSKRRSAKADPDAQDNDEPETVPHQTMLSCDVDVEVPNLFHVRTRDVLRRTKYREFEYTSGRVKALRSLLAAGIHEETAKNVLGDAVAGKGYAPYHKQVWMALAKGSHEGGEAQRAALIDLRTTSLMEKLEERCSVAKGYWDVASACQDLCKEEK